MGLHIIDHPLGCPRFSSRTPSVFLFFFLYNTPLFSSLFSGENSVKIVIFWALS